MGPIMFQPWHMSKYFGLAHLFYQLLLAHMANQSFFKKNTVLFTVFCKNKHVFFSNKNTRSEDQVKKTDPMNIPIPPARRYSLSWVKAKPGTKMVIPGSVSNDFRRVRNSLLLWICFFYQTHWKKGFQGVKGT